MEEREIPSKIIVKESNKRLDIYLQERFNSLSRSYIQKLIKENKILIRKNQKDLPKKKIKPSLMVEIGMEISIEDSLAKEKKPIEPIKIDFDILYEDEYLSIIHKPAGISVHPPQNESKGITLLNGILYKWKELQIQNPTSNFRAGIVHRLDKMTEGLLIIAKNPSTQWKLAKLFQSRNIQKNYIAWLMNTPPEEEGRIELPLKRNPKDRKKMRVDPTGRMATTEYKIEKVILSNRNRKFTKVYINLITGRTHQIRAHFHYLNCPIVGDTLYASMPTHLEKFGLLLLSKKISFLHPETSRPIIAEIPEPKRFLEFEKKCQFY
ncbi:MAG: RluA family pseudouridine synthase [Leptonema sp. (in: bacteria)]